MLNDHLSRTDSARDADGGPGSEVLRREIKVSMPRDRAYGLVAWLDARAPRDTYSEGEEGYVVSSIYFDTPELEILSGLYERADSRYRVRWYGDDERAWFERKMRMGNAVSKRRWETSAEVLRTMSSDHSDQLPPAFEDGMNNGRLGPVLALGFRRIAWEPAPGIRIAIDRDIRTAAADSVDAARVPPLSAPVAEGRAILELKSDGDLTHELLEATLSEAAFLPVGLSKFSLAAATLGLGESRTLLSESTGT